MTVRSKNHTEVLRLLNRNISGSSDPYPFPEMQAVQATLDVPLSNGSGTLDAFLDYAPDGVTWQQVGAFTRRNAGAPGGSQTVTASGLTPGWSAAVRVRYVITPAAGAEAYFTLGATVQRT